MKRAIRAICSVTAFVFCITAFAYTSVQADTYDYERAARVLEGLHILEGYEDGSLGLDKVVKRDEFAVLMARVTNAEITVAESAFVDVPDDYWAAGAIEACRSMGLISGYSSETFAPDEPISHEQAIKVLVNILGYDLQAQAQGGYPAGYALTATRLGLTRGVAGEGNDILKRGPMAQLLYNALHTPSAEKEYGTVDKRVITSGTLLLEHRLGIVTGSGIVTATHCSRLSSVSNLRENQVEISGELFTTEEFNADRFLGYSVVYYAKKNDAEENLILFVMADKNNFEITVAAEDILSENTAFGKTLFVYQDGTNVRKVDISPYADLIYNGVSIGGFRAADMMPADGKVTLLDNDSDGIYDIVFVTEYNTYIAGSMGGDYDSIYDLYDSSRHINLLNPGQKTVTDIIKGGKPIAFASLQKKQILSVAQSRNTTGTRVNEILVGDETVTGVITEKSADNTIVVEGELYHLADSIPPLNIPMVGDEGTFYLTADKRVANFEKSAASGNGWNYGYLIKADKSKGVSKYCMFRLLTVNGQVEVLNGAAKMTVDGVGGLTDADDILKRLSDDDKRAMEQMIRYQRNQDGKITQIDTVTLVSEKEDNTSLSLDAEVTNRVRYMPEGNALGDTKPEFLVNEKVKVFLIPTDKSDYDNYKVGSLTYFISRGFYNNFQVYDMSDAMYAGVIVIPNAGTAPIEDRTPVAIITSISTAINDTGMITQKLTVYQDGTVRTYVGADDKALAAAKVGDIIRVATNSKGEATQMEPLLNPATDAFQIISVGANAGKFYSNWVITYGVLTKKEDDVLVISTGANVLPYRLSSTRVNIFDPAAKKLIPGAVTDIEEHLHSSPGGARVLVITATSSTKDVILLK